MNLDHVQTEIRAIREGIVSDPAIKKGARSLDLLMRYWPMMQKIGSIIGRGEVASLELEGRGDVAVPLTSGEIILPDQQTNALLIELIRNANANNEHLRDDLSGIRQILARDTNTLADFIRTSTVAQAQITSTMSSMQLQIEALMARQTANTQAIDEIRQQDKRRVAMATGMKIALGGVISVVTTLGAWVWLFPTWVKAAIIRMLANGGSGLP